MPTQMSPNLNLPLPNATSEDLRLQDMVAIKDALVILDQKINRQIADNPTKPPSYSLTVNRTEPNDYNLTNYVIDINTFGVAGGTTINLIEDVDAFTGFQKAIEDIDFTITPTSVVLVGDKRNGATATVTIETKLNSVKKQVLLKVDQPALVWNEVNPNVIIISKYYDQPTISVTCSAYGNGTYIALGINTGFASVSTDGIKWRNKPIPWGSYLDIAFGNGVFVTYNRGDHNTYISSDGINWVTGNQLGSWSYTWKIVFAHGMFIAASSGTSSNHLKISTDGINWTTKSLGANSAEWIVHPIENNEFILFGNDESAGYPSITTYTFTTSDFQSLVTQPPIPICQGNYFISSGEINGVKKYVAVNNSTIAYISNDGITWTTVTLTKSSGWRDICYGGGKFVVTSGIPNLQNTGSEAMYSVDGINWIHFSIEPGDIWTTVLYDGTNFIVNGYNQNRGSSVETLNI